MKIYYKQSNPLIPEVWYIVLTPERYTSNGNDKSLTSNTIRQAKILWHFPRTQTHTHRRFNIRPQPQASLCHPPSCSHPPFLFFQSCVHICHHCSSVHTHTRSMSAIPSGETQMPRSALFSLFLPVAVFGGRRSPSDRQIYILIHCSVSLCGCLFLRYVTCRGYIRWHKADFENERHRTFLI